MIFVTGDCHADFSKFHMRSFPQQKELTHDDYVIICGDFGGIWKDCPSERYQLDALNDRSFTTLFVDGNHDCFDRLYSDEFEAVDFHGGKAHKIRDNIYHLMRGNVFELEGKKFFAFGGASSHDIRDGVLDEKDYESKSYFKKVVACYRYAGKQFRINHESWWKEELPSQEEMDYGTQTLHKHGNKVDYVITHCLPKDIAALCGFHESDTITDYFSSLVESGLDFNHWYAGHYHQSNYGILGKYNVLYREIIRIV